MPHSTPAAARLPHPPDDHGPAQLEHTDYDVVVVGGGPPGEIVASRAAAGGLSVIVVEAELVGGECSYWACMPSKALLRPVEARSDARAIGGSRQSVTGALDAAAVLARRDEFTHGWDDSSQVGWLDSEQLTLVRGRGRITGDRQVEVVDSTGDRITVTARHAVVLCVGSIGAAPPIDGLDGVAPWGSRDATSADQPPGRLLVIGGGVVGVEMATAWAALGSQVTVLAAEDQLLARMEPQVSPIVRNGMQRAGVDVRTGVRATAARRDTGPDGSAVIVTLDDGTEVEGDELLVAAGRRPATGDIGLDVVGLEPGEALQTDDSMLVQGVDGGWLYAAGDCAGRAMLTHMGKYQARVCGDVIAARANCTEQATGAWQSMAATADHAAVPQVVFTDPPAGSVGLTAQQACDAGLSVRVVEQDLGAVAGASLYADDYQGWACLVVDEDRRVVVGATFVGPGTAELVHAATIAVVGEVPLDRLWHAVPSYPTISEVWLRLLEAYGL
ncbi:MAG: NAD(P)/FAD-dependent oxidoreductase [Actinomycetota bacterium]|nr:NAD(P)/FAD-dependent oxidoreductase [Actinomycetota bacterium]